MIEDVAIARPYAQAALEQAKEEKRLSEWSTMLALLASIVSVDQMQALIRHPKVSKTALSELVLELCGGDIARTEINFVRILIGAGRLSVVPDIFSLFEAERAREEGVVEVQVISAYPLVDNQHNLITEVMAKKLGKTVRIKGEVDEYLIGGVVVRVGDSVVNVSIRGFLEDLHHMFAG